VRSNERMLGVFSMLKEIDREKKVLDDNQAWRAAKLSGEVTTYLDSNRDTMQKIAGRSRERQEAYQSVKGFSDNAEIIRFETSKAEKELAEAGVDQKAAIRSQKIYRPQMPSEIGIMEVPGRVLGATRSGTTSTR